MFFLNFDFSHCCCNQGPTGTPRRIDVDSTWILITSICRRPNFDKYPHRFHVLFRCNFDGQKIQVVFTYLFRCNFDGRKIHVDLTYFFRCNFDGRKIHVDSTYFFEVFSMVKKYKLFSRTCFDVILMVEISTLFHVLFSM